MLRHSTTQRTTGPQAPRPVVKNTEVVERLQFAHSHVSKKPRVPPPNRSGHEVIVPVGQSPSTDKSLSRNCEPSIRNPQAVGPSQASSLRGGEMARSGRSHFFLSYFTSPCGRLDYLPRPTSRETAPKAPRAAQKPLAPPRDIIAVKLIQKGSYRSTACPPAPIPRRRHVEPPAALPDPATAPRKGPIVKSG